MWKLMSVPLIAVVAAAVMLGGCSSDTWTALNVSLGVIDKQSAEYIQYLVGREAFMQERAEMAIDAAAQEIEDKRYQIASCRVDAKTAADVLAEHQAAEIQSSAELERIAALVRVGQPVTLASGSVWDVAAMRQHLSARLANHKIIQKNVATAAKTVQIFQSCAEQGEVTLLAAAQQLEGLRLARERLSSQFDLLRAMETTVGPNATSGGSEIAAAEAMLAEFNKGLEEDIAVFDELARLQKPAGDLLNDLPAPGDAGVDPLLSAVDEALANSR